MNDGNKDTIMLNNLIIYYTIGLLLSTNSLYSPAFNKSILPKISNAMQDK